MKYNEFFNELRQNETLVQGYLINDAKNLRKMKPEVFEEFTLSYIKNSGKKLRPTVLMLCCEAMGGNKLDALPIAAAVEVFHTWTLVHDDIIDNDSLRRGVDTVHIQAKNYAINQLGLPNHVATKYGNDIAMLIGDIQHGWSVTLITKNLIQQGIKPEIVLHLINELEIDMMRTLVEGEMLDVDFGLHYKIEDLSEEMILDMLWKKTGVFYEYCGMAGAVIGQKSIEETNELLALKEFCSLCGTAFQVYDDILGLVGKQDSLGKPVGSDIREGKKTILIRESMKNASDKQKQTIKATLGNGNASEKEIVNVINLVKDLGGVERAEEICKQYVKKAQPNLNAIPDSKYKDLLFDWSNYMIDRSY